MNKKFLFIAQLLYLTLLTTSCNSNLDKSDVPLKTIPDQEFLKIIPSGNNNQHSFSYVITQKYTRALGLSIIENGFDSLFFRIWFFYNYKNQVVDFKRKNGIWSAEFHNFQVREDIVEYKRIVVKLNSVNIIPKSGWDSFMNKAISLGILTLPDDSELPGYSTNVPTDADFVVVEIANTKKYRIYSYSLPGWFPEVKEAKAMEDIMKLIEQEFGIKRGEKF
jgi:hypothetical protein